jgi:cellobiose epimerase
MTSSEIMHHEYRLLQIRNEAEQELKNILSYWKDHAIDHGNGGFFGKINNENIPDVTAPKGSVLNGRILWAFSAASAFYKDKTYLDVAKRAYDYINSHFIDTQYGGAYWTVDAKGKPLETKKQVYACAFVLYGLSEFYGASRSDKALHQAINLYHTLVERAHDNNYGGYFEAFKRDWQPTDDQRLSGKDFNEKKSMNTNLHVLEGFANLYRVWPDENLKKQIKDLLNIFSDKIIDPVNNHLRLFFDEQWNNKPALISYGHDIEAAWLLQECANIINDAALIEHFKEASVRITNAAMNGLDTDGGLWYEYDLRAGKLIREKHWWPQAEAIVGFVNAWQLSGATRYADATINCWEFIKTHLLNPAGEWYWGIDEALKIMNDDKAGLWKCPYHNSRACLEIIKRINVKT